MKHSNKHVKITTTNLLFDTHQNVNKNEKDKITKKKFWLQYDFKF